MPFPAFFSTVGKVVGGLLQSGANYLFGSNQQAQQNAYNERMIKKMNSYNSPSASMNRLIAAGVSPKAALNSLADSPSLGAQSAVNTATPYQGNAPATDFASSLSSMYANDLVDSQAVNQRINNESQRQLNQLSAENLQETIRGLGLSNQGKSTDLEFQRSIRNIQRANLSIEQLIGLHELFQYELAIAENPYVEYFYTKGGLYDASGLQRDYPYPDLPKPMGSKDDTFSEATTSRYSKNRTNAIKAYDKEIANQLSARGIEAGRLNYISQGISKEASNHLKALDVEMLRLLAQGKVEQFRERLADTGLSRKEWLMKLADTFSQFSPLASALLSGSQIYSNVATGASRSRISHSGNFHPDMGSVSFSW